MRLTSPAPSRTLIAYSDVLYASLTRFEYLFDFKFGAQVVDVEIIRAARGTRFYLLINRRQFKPAREGLEPGFPAPRFRELHPEEQDRGVIRDDREQRVVKAPVALFEGLLRTCDRVAPNTWGIFCSEWGVEWGRRAVVELEAQCLEQTEQSLRERPMTEVADRLVTLLREQGWGDAKLDLSTASAGALVVRIDHSPLAAASRRVEGRRCHLLAGLLAAVMTHLASRRLHAEEIECAGQGHAHCKILVVGQTRREQVAALAERGVPVAEVVQALEVSRGS